MSDLTSYPPAGNDPDPVRRREYDSPGIDPQSLPVAPWPLIRDWVSEAIAAAESMPGLGEPTAVSVATVDADGIPNVRTVLARFLDERGPGFVSSLNSTKAAELAANAHLALSYSWSALFRAIRFRGIAAAIEEETLTAYWRTRPYGSQIAACASVQSHPIGSRQELEREFATWAAHYPETGSVDDVPMPADFHGWRVQTHEVEFWAGRRSRLHDRVVYTRVGDGGLDDPASWLVSRRQP